MPHLFIRKAIALLCLLLLTILIAGCSPSIEQVIRNHDSFPLHKALAFAKDFSGSWVYGQSWKSTTEEGAAAAALARCDIERLNRNILSRCEIYSGRQSIVVGGHYPKPVTTAESLYPPPEKQTTADTRTKRKEHSAHGNRLCRYG